MFKNYYMRHKQIYLGVILGAILGAFLFFIFPNTNFKFYVVQGLFFLIIYYSFSSLRVIRFWGYLRFFGIILSIGSFGMMCERLILIQEGWGGGVGNPIDDTRFIESLFGLISSLVILGIGEIVIYLRDIRFLLSLNNMNKDDFKCDDCGGDGFKMRYGMKDKICTTCSGLGFLRK